MWIVYTRRSYLSESRDLRSREHPNILQDYLEGIWTWNQGWVLGKQQAHSSRTPHHFCLVMAPSGPVTWPPTPVSSPRPGESLAHYYIIWRSLSCFIASPSMSLWKHLPPGPCAGSRQHSLRLCILIGLSLHLDPKTGINKTLLILKGGRCYLFLIEANSFHLLGLYYLTCGYVFEHACVCACVYVCMWACMWVCMWACVCMSVHMCLCTHVCAAMYVNCEHVCAHVC